MQFQFCVVRNKTLYKATAEATRVVWLRRLLGDLEIKQTTAKPSVCDNQIVLKLTKNLVYYALTKHIKAHHHYIQELVQDGTIEMIHCPTSEKVADILTDAFS